MNLGAFFWEEGRKLGILFHRGYNAFRDKSKWSTMLHSLANKHKRGSGGRETRSLRLTSFLVCRAIQFAHSFAVREIAFKVIWFAWLAIVEKIIRRAPRHQCGVAPLTWEITTLESNSISTLSHPCSLANLTPSRITIASNISTPSHLILRFRPPITSPLEFRAMTPIPPIPVCLHYEVSQLMRIAFGFGAVHLSILWLDALVGWYLCV